MGIAGNHPGRRDLSGTVHQNGDVGWCFGVEGGGVLSQCGPVRTDALLFYRPVFPDPGRRDRVARIPDCLARSVWLDMAGPDDRRWWRCFVVLHRTSLGKIFKVPEAFPESNTVEKCID